MRVLRRRHRRAHGHIADITDHRLLCVCRPCYLLFAPQGAGGGRYRGVGEEVRRVGDLVLDDARWDSLRVPVDLVFFFRQTGAGHLLAFYPGPGGATESELDLASWDDISGANPVLDNLEHDVEAVLLRRHEDEYSCYLVPIDLCYELVGVVRSRWTGLGGGPRCGARSMRSSPGSTTARRRGPGRRESSRQMAGRERRRRRRRRRPARPDARLHLRETWSPTGTPRADRGVQDAGHGDAGARVHALALRCQARVEPVRRSYSDSEAAQVVDLFGERARWGQTMQTMQLAFMTQVLPGFTGPHVRAGDAVQL